MIQRYRVEWCIDVYAESYKEAAQQAWGTMRRENSTANYFTVFDQDNDGRTVDLSENPELLNIIKDKTNE